MKRLNNNELRQFYLDFKKEDKDWRRGHICIGSAFFVLSLIFLIFDGIYWQSTILGLVSLITGVFGSGMIVYGGYMYHKVKEEIEVNEFL